MTKYYAEYQSAVTGTTGCIKTFMSEAREELVFPPQVEYHCDLCSKTHSFRLFRMHMVSTPSQQRQFDTYCTEQKLERDVEVPHP